jgi:quercetin dioxygenase-like cupin family protein
MGETSTSFLATGAQTDGAFALVDERAGQGESVPLHRHAADVESFYVLDGEVTFFLGEEPGATVGSGSFVHVPAGEVHGFRIASERARYLILTTPHHGEFYRAITLPSGADGGRPAIPVDGSRIRAAAQQYGIEFVGPLPE